MEKYLRPERFHAIPNTTDADKTWLHRAYSINAPSENIDFFFVDVKRWKITSRRGGGRYVYSQIVHKSAL